jgi:hypothetical protein
MRSIIRAATVVTLFLSMLMISSSPSRAEHPATVPDTQVGADAAERAKGVRFTITETCDPAPCFEPSSSNATPTRTQWINGVLRNQRPGGFTKRQLMYVWHHPRFHGGLKGDLMWQRVTTTQSVRNPASDDADFGTQAAGYCRVWTRSSLRDWRGNPEAHIVHEKRWYADGTWDVSRTPNDADVPWYQSRSHLYEDNDNYAWSGWGNVDDNWHTVDGSGSRHAGHYSIRIGEFVSDGVDFPFGPPTFVHNKVWPIVWLDAYYDRTVRTGNTGRTDCADI